MGKIVIRPLPFIGLPAVANTTPELSQQHNPHSSKPTRGFVQSGFNEVADSACVIPPLSPRPHRTLQIPMMVVL
jgi:hypothetical protein